YENLMMNENSNDILIPRRFHSIATSAELSATAVSLDPEMLERRWKRKQMLGPHPSNRAPWKDVDRSAARIPAFDLKWWTLGDVARWVLARTPEAVDGLSIDEDGLPDALTEIHDALVNEKISAWSITSNEPVPCELPGATWSIYEFGFAKKNGLLHP